jgi:predicted CopG family antitoxin
MTKIISISDEAYNELAKLKNGLSFSQIILALTNMKKKESIMDYAGLLTKEEGEKMSEYIKKTRQGDSRRIS